MWFHSTVDDSHCVNSYISTYLVLVLATVRIIDVLVDMWARKHYSFKGSVVSLPLMGCHLQELCITHGLFMEILSKYVHLRLRSFKKWDPSHLLSLYSCLIQGNFANPGNEQLPSRPFLSGKLVIYQLVCKENLILPAPHTNHKGDFSSLSPCLDH